MKTDESIHHGFKRITVSNWKNADEILQFPYIVPDEIWVNACLKPVLSSSVPKEIVALFEVARGSMIYGWFFYPLITLASEQFTRVLEAGARSRCKELGMPTELPRKNGKMRDANFSELIDNLFRAGKISLESLERWQAARGLRNGSSHPSSQSIICGDMALSTARSTVDLLNQLFSD
jgi:hypothetical protein